MKNKNLLLLLGAGLAYYLFYKMYAKKTTTNDVKKPVMSPVLNDLTPNANNVITSPDRLRELNYYDQILYKKDNAKLLNDITKYYDQMITIL